jgi:hypothetical protein
MTDQVAPNPQAAADQAARVEALRSRRAGGGGGTSSRRRHPASGSRIGVAGGGLAAMFGLVAVFGLMEKSAAADPATPAPSQVVVVIHRNGEAPADPPGTAVVAPASGPIALAARPVVSAATHAQQTPAATTNGSR